MADAAVSFAIEKLNEFVTQQVNIRIGVKDDIEWLKDELGYLLNSVRDAEAHQDKDNIRRWTDSIKDVANQAAIVLERFSAQQEEHAAHEQGGVLDRMRSFICICKKEANLYDIGKDIESLKKKIIGIKSRRDDYGIKDIITATPNVQKRRRTLLRATSFEHETDMVGFQDVVRPLLAQLRNEDPSLGFISIHGMGGLGKSTLASKLYHSGELSHFRSRAWVCVSEDYDITLVLRKLIKCFKRDEQDLLNKMEEVDLLRDLRNILLDCDRYLVVIDDIWNVEVWKKIKCAFPDKKNGSRIIITTRYKIVADNVDNKCYVHELRFLRGDEPWQLFCKRTKPTSNLEILGKEMVGKCGGLPLAIVILSGLLLQNKTYTFWSNVKDHLWTKLKGESLEIRDLLNVSYGDLSPQTRQCFLYLARFPEDCTIEAFELKLLWIAEEFVSEVEEDDGVDMEDVAEDYVNELINRNMIQIQLMSPEGQVLECRVHDLIRDLAIEKAKEEKILGIFYSSSKRHSNPIVLQGQTRHAINKGIGRYLKLFGSNKDNSKLRSLALTNGTARLEVEELKLMFKGYIHLKVLDLTRVVGSEEIPEEIGDLIFLKYLGLVCGKRGKSLVIPPSIGKLKKLQTLCGTKSYHNSRYKFPTEICELKELRHLIFSDISGSVNISSRQTKLQTLRPIKYREWLQIDTINLTNLHTLVIRAGQSEEEEYESSCASIANLTSLRTLIFEAGRSVISTIQSLSSCKQLKRVKLVGRIKDPEELSFLPDSVTDIKLLNTEFTKDPMPTLGSLPNLTALSLSESDYLGDKMVCSADAFPCLQYLRLDYLRLKEFQVDDGALPSLKAFQIYILGGRGVENKIPQRITSLPPVPDIWECIW